MDIQIKDKTYQLNFGIRFILLMNQNHKIAGNGIETGMGLNQAITVLSMYDAVGLVEVLQAALWINQAKPTKPELEEWLNTEADITKLCDGMLKALKEGNATKAQVKNVLKAMKRSQEKAIKMNSEK